MFCCFVVLQKVLSCILRLRLTLCQFYEMDPRPKLISILERHGKFLLTSLTQKKYLRAKKKSEQVQHDTHKKSQSDLEGLGCQAVQSVISRYRPYLNRGRVSEFSRCQNFQGGEARIYRWLSRNMKARGSSTNRNAGGPTKV